MISEIVCEYDKIVYDDKMTKVNPVSLMKSLKTMCEESHYKEGFKVDLIFTTKENCGKAIEQIIGGQNE